MYIRGYGFTLVETLTTIAVLVIVLGLMVSLSRHVREASADELTKDILHRLDAVMDVYVHQNGAIPAVTPFIGQQIPPESQLRQQPSEMMSRSSGR